ncbi:MAG: DUF2878 domain-containing protein [Idiomarina sp.]|nr:DUF2878 domain-containing protein [Idiomarina sp.]
MQNYLARPSVQRLVHFIVFDIVWLAAVWGRDTWLLLTLVLVAFLYAVSWRSLWPQRYKLLLLAIVGLILEYVVVSVGVLNFTGTTALPAWLYLLWIGFVAMAFVAMDWLAGRYFYAALFGLIFGPITYIAGVRFGAAERLVELPWMIGAYAVMWGAIMVLFSYLVKPSQAQGLTEVNE